MFKHLYLDAPCVGALEKKYLAQAIDSCYVSSVGPFIKRFEDRFAKYIGTRKAVSTQSGTAALHISLHELGIGKGDEVIVPVLTFIATVNPVAYVGAKPVFADIDPLTWNIDTVQIERCITKRTKAIILVHLYGNPCNMDAIMQIARKYGLFVIEDATESLGARYRGKHTGRFGDFGCFSFNGNKIITTGGGGMVTGRNKDAMEHVKFLVNQARDESKGYFHPEVGFNYRMTNIEAALGLAQMQRLNKFLAQKIEFNRIYKEELKEIDSIRFQDEYPGSEPSYWLTCNLFDKDVEITKLQFKLKELGVPSRRLFMPITEFPPYKDSKRSNYKNAYKIFQHGLCLPSSTLNSEDDIRKVCKIIKELV